MSREIKFRVWDKKEKKMIYYDKDCSAPDMTLNGVLISHNKQSNVSAQYILVQYTGLKDKNGKEGKEVYKGDLLGSRYFSAVLEVDQITEGTNCGQWIARAKDGGYQDLFEAIVADGYKIIGNIHQNPELLKSSPASGSPESEVKNE